MNADNLANVASRNTRPHLADPQSVELSTHASAVSWSAIFAGAAGAAALSLILLILGTGLGLSSVSPYSGRGAGAATFGASTILWLTFTQLAASGMGGYLAGRLRTRWASVHTDEVYFRDTAHGFLSWAVASVVTAAFLTSAIGSIVGETAKVGAAVGGGAATAAVASAIPTGSAGASDSNDAAGPMGYFIDSMFRSNTDTASAGAATSADQAASATAAATASSTPSAPAELPVIDPAVPQRSSGIQPSGANATALSGNRESSSEIARIFAYSFQSGSLTPEDTRYVAKLIAQRNGMSAADAERKVTATFTQIQTKAKAAETAARDAADKARRAASLAALWLFVALLAGAFVASFAATFGGRLRDL